jgi:uncharacterized protein YdhG (YjbR/CyaY superfamily)
MAAGRIERTRLMKAGPRVQTIDDYIKACPPAVRKRLAELRATIRAFRKDLRGYKTSKGAIRLPLDAPLPLTLIAKVVKYRVAENTLPVIPAIDTPA